MPVYQTPGVYIEEIPSKARPIESAATSVAAFVGPARRGPAGEATLIGKLDDYKALYGDITSTDDAMGLSVQAFYLNGGKTAYICRLAGNGSAAAEIGVTGAGDGTTPTANPVLTIRASSVGAWGEEIHVKLIKPDPDATTFALEVGHQEDGAFVVDESFADLTMREGDDGYAPTLVSQESGLIDLILAPAATPGHPTALFQAASIRGGELPAAASHFSDALAGATADAISLNLNGRGFERIAVDLTGANIAGADRDADADEIRQAVESAIRAHSTLQVFQDVTVTYAGGRFTVTSPAQQSRAALEIAEGRLADLMRLSRVAKATLTGAPRAAAPDAFSANVPAAADRELQLTVDGHGPHTVAIDFDALQLTGANAADGAQIAAALEGTVRAIDRGIPSFRHFTCSYDAQRQFVLTSGAVAPRSSGITVAAGTLATFLGLDAGTLSPGREVEQGTSPVIPVADDGPGGEGRQLTGGVSVAPSAADYADFYQAILRKRRDVTMIVLPGETWTPTGPTAAISNTLAHAEAMANRMVILDPPRGYELADGSDVEAMMPPTSTYAVMYYPWVDLVNPLYDPDRNPSAPKTVPVAPSAFAAGLWTRTDGRRGVWKAPAGVQTRLVGATGFEYEVEDTEQAQLNPRGINCYRKIPGFGPVVWGARTLATRARPEWRYVPVRRTAIFIEESIYAGIQWAVFEPNDHPLWGALRTNIGAFMNGLFRAGAFQGKTADEAYFVRCNLGDTMTQADIDRGQVIALVGFAPLKPAEFVIVRIQQKVGQQ